jgi:hypothetical protein
MAITLEAIQSEQKKIAEMIAAFEKQPTFPISVQIPQLNDGEKFVGAVISADGSLRHCLILLPGSNENIKWQGAMDWAKSIGGELPDRIESALLFATMKHEFKKDYYWTREQHAEHADYAWMQYFGYGNQSYGRKVYEWRARAVRRLIIQ